MRQVSSGAVATALVALALLAAAPSAALAKDRSERIGPPVAGHRSSPPVPRGHWWDGAHGHRHAYPVVGWQVHTLPPPARFVAWGGVRYGYWDGVWYSPYGAGFVVARPPVGIVVDVLPPFRTVVALGGVTYLYANGVYYRELPDGAYQVVPSPIVGAADGAGRMYVYPKLGQSAERQASDEYECHRWAVGQTGFDPSSQATGQVVSTAGSRSDYVRAQTACLEGRGYTVR